MTSRIVIRQFAPRFPLATRSDRFRNCTGLGTLITHPWLSGSIVHPLFSAVGADETPWRRHGPDLSVLSCFPLGQDWSSGSPVLIIRRSDFNAGFGNSGLRNSCFGWSVIGSSTGFARDRLHRWSAMQSGLSVLYGLESPHAEGNAGYCRGRIERVCSPGSKGSSPQTGFETRGTAFRRRVAPKEDQ